MLVTEKSALSEQIQKLVYLHGKGRDALLPVLQEIQMQHGFISDYAQQEIARMLGIHPVEVYGVVTFYHFLGTQHRGRYLVRMCQTISCDLAGKEAIARTLERELGIKFGETSPEGKVSLEYINCMGMCDQGPALLINDKVFTHLTPSKVVEIIHNHCR